MPSGPPSRCSTPGHRDVLADLAPATNYFAGARLDAHVLLAIFESPLRPALRVTREGRGPFGMIDAVHAKIRFDAAFLIT